MKICAISFHSCPFSLLGGDGTGGLSVYLRELCAVATDFPDIKLDIFTRIQNPEIRETKHFSSQARVIHLKGGPESPLDRTKLFDYLPEFMKSLTSFIQQEGECYDLLYTHYWLSGLIGTWMKEKFSLPLVHIYHTLAFMKNRCLKYEQKEHRKRQNSEVLIAQNADAIVSSAKNEKKNIIDEFGIPSSSTKVIYPGVNEKLFFPFKNHSIRHKVGCRKNERILLYVGRLDPVKGLMDIVRAIGLLRQQFNSLYHQTKLVVIGGGENKDLMKNREYLRIKNFIVQNELSEKIVFLGSKKQTQLKKYYSAAEALVVPSLYESFGLVALEAMACGTPVLASHIGEMRSLIISGSNGLFFWPKNPSSLAQTLAHFDSHKNGFWGKKKIREHILKNFSWKRTAEETFALFKMLNGRKPCFTTKFQPDESPRLV
jgi:D-inositol-3-phosphate glycosyltransferase